MDAQGRGQAGDFDPADQWVFNPSTGSYELRLDTSADTSEPPASAPAPAPGGRAAAREAARRRAVPEQRGRRAAPRGGRDAKGGAGGVPQQSGPVSRRKPKPKKSKTKKALIWGGGTMAFLLVGGSVAAYLVYQHLNGNIKKVDVGENNPAVIDGPVNILVIGTDTRSGKGNGSYGDKDSVGHADTTILFHVSEDRSNATALSIPRDLITDVPDCTVKQEDGSRKTIPGERQVRFNSSLGQDGRDPGCTWNTVEKLTGLEVDHFMMADFNAVKTLSSAVGGVEVCLARDIDDPKSKLKLSAGRHKIQGEDALAFVRTRHGVGFESDLDRIKLQQQFLSSMIREMKSGGTFSNPKKMWKLSNAATDALTVDTGIGSVKKLMDLGKDLSKVDIKNITFATVPVFDNTDQVTVLLDKPKAEPLFAMVRQDVSLTEVKKKEKAAKGKEAARLKGTKADPANVRVKVLNGSGKLGAAQETVTWMQNEEGIIHSTNGQNAPSEIKKTTLEYAPNQADQARRLADSMGLPGSALKPGTVEADPMAEMTLTLGEDYKGKGVPITAPRKAPEGVQRIGADDKNVCAK
ncbi:LCP family protein [Streptomyces sp. AC563]|uniref:LCP family protein n=1 Tax=Streptomyces buecherae TaxID=2763006 RepID=UPI00164DA193|nr:LCP family protein [Streptomyces buecherae]MBC3982654.1 LCP family protein [Streptomyces buecherae]MBC3988458.1 LCP family protein [Streptomyces buecherae]QNJ42182.1 LCP family protein [Streptomyces buecherae]